MESVNKRDNSLYLGRDLKIGKNVSFGYNVIIEDGVEIGDNVIIENNVIIKSFSIIGKDSFIGSNCIIGERGLSSSTPKKLMIGRNSLIRSGTIIYCDSSIGDFFQTGHNVTIREKTKIGCNVSIGTLSDIQGNCEIGNYVRMHSNVHIGQLSKIEDFVWIFPYVVLTNDPTPPSDSFVGVTIHSFAIVATGSIVMPGITIESDTLVGAGAIVTKNVNKYDVVVGNPAKRIADIRDIKNKNDGSSVYPWRYHFKKYMPWEDTDFESWVNNLSIHERENFKL